LARAKLAHLLDVAMERLRLTRAIALRMADSPAFDAFPELRGQLNNDDLLPAATFKPLPDAFEYRDHAFSFSPLTPLLLQRKLTSLAAQPGVELRWRPAGTPPVPRAGYQQRLEEAIEYGPSFKDELILERLWSKHLPTVLRREAPVNEAESAWDRINPLDRLEVLRTERDDRVSFLFEELLPLSERDIEVGFVSTRIFHCDSIIGTGRFEHVDASHLVYDVDTYAQRLASPMKDKIKAQAHIKLFWLGSCSIDGWKGLLSTTYPRNELVAEYLTGVRSLRPVTRQPIP
jgi:hypothetical protein